jgi:hypothetical protein
MQEGCMGSVEIGVITFVLVFGGSLFGLYIGTRLPTQHQSSDTKDVVRLGMGMVGTIAALVLGLLISSAKTYYDNQRDELTQFSANIVLLGRMLDHYGPEAAPASLALRANVAQLLADTWPHEPIVLPPGTQSPAKPDQIFDLVRTLTPKDDIQRTIQSQAFSLLSSLGQMRWLLYEQRATTVSRPLLAVMILWLTCIFVSWGLYSPNNATTLTTFFVSALSVSGAIFLIFELYSPYRGFLRVSSMPLRMAYAALTQ